MWDLLHYFTHDYLNPPALSGQRWTFEDLHNRYLPSLRKAIPDLTALYSRPKEYLGENRVVIRPKPLLQRTVVAVTICTGLFGFALVIPSIFYSSYPLVLLGIPMLAAAIMLSWFFWRSSWCVLRSDGVDFCTNAETIFCPWSMFHADGQMFVPSNRQIAIVPIAGSAMSGVIYTKRHEIQKGVNFKTPLRLFRSDKELVLQPLYEVEADELGLLLMYLGHKLGEKPLEQSAAVQPLELTEDSRTLPRWIALSVTRMQLPSVCCDCCEPTELRKTIRAHNDKRMSLAVPWCEACQKRAERRGLRTALLAGGVTATVFVALPLLAEQRIPDLAAFIVPMVFMIVLSGCVAIVAREIGRSVPVKMAYSDSKAMVYLRFVNPAYARIVQEHVQTR